MVEARPSEPVVPWAGFVEPPSEASKETEAPGTPLLCWSRTTNSAGWLRGRPGRNCPGKELTDSREAGWPGFAVAVNWTEAAPEEADRLWLPAVVPRVQVVDALPFWSVLA
jgi:hypothetical protein